MGLSREMSRESEGQRGAEGTHWGTGRNVIQEKVVCLFQAEDGIRDLVRSRGLGDVYKRQHHLEAVAGDDVDPPPHRIGLQPQRRDGEQPILVLSLIHI